MDSPPAKRFCSACACCNTEFLVSAGIDRRDVLSGSAVAVGHPRGGILFAEAQASDPFERSVLASRSAFAYY